MGLRKLLSDIQVRISARGTKDVSMARAIEIATKSFHEHKVPITEVGLAWRTREHFIMTAHAEAIGGGWYVPIDRRSGEAKPPFLIER